MLAFTKMHGLGNDFVVVDGTQVPFAPDAEFLGHLAARRFGVGCDQILVVDPPPENAADVDFGYRIFNADGSEVGQCGNGARCLARFVIDKGLATKTRLRVRTCAATLDLELLDDGRVRVNMGVPRFEPDAIPLRAAVRSPRYPLALAGNGSAGQTLEIGAVGLGNPHAVIEVDDVDAAPVASIGAQLQSHPSFPDRVNVGFARYIDPEHLRLRVFERGAGETLACGSGACAAVAVGRAWGKLGTRVSVTLNGGDLDVEWSGENQPLWMTGPAITVYEGRISWPK